MTLLTVQVSVTSGKYLENVLSSIRKSKSSCTEIIVVNSGTSERVSELCRIYNAKEIRQHCSLLMSRYLGTVNATGEHVLILDETRIPSDNLIDSLINSNQEMIAFPEVQMGKGFINHLDRIDKRITFNTQSSLLGDTSLIIPRFYSTDLLRKAFSLIQSKISLKKFNQIVAKDDRIIFYEALKISNSKVFLSNYKILHYNDTNIFLEFRKYARYGSTSRVLDGTEYESMTQVVDKFRKINSFRDIPVLVLYGIRGLSYELGYHFIWNRG